MSDSRTERTDKGADCSATLVEARGIASRARLSCATRSATIRAAVEAALAAAGVDVVLVTGGTGVAPRDVTIEAVAPLFEKEIPGFGELFRMLSFAEIGAAAMLSRATAGVASGRAIFLLPGSPAALELAMTRLILPEASHLLSQVRRASRSA